MLPFNFVCFRLNNYAVSLQSARTGFSANWSEASTVTAFIKLSLFERIQMHNYPKNRKFQYTVILFFEMCKKHPWLDMLIVLISLR